MVGLRKMAGAAAPLQFDLFATAAVEPLPLPRKMVAVAVEAVVAPRKERVRKVWPATSAIVPSGEVAKFEANLAAIKVVKEGRDLSDEDRAVLNAYSGWGSLGQKFASSDPAWVSRIEALDALLTEDERKSVRASVNNAHYTSSDVIAAVWAVVKRLGFRGGRVLEPAAGTGFFIGGMPKEIAERSQVTAVEIDTVSAGIADALYGRFGVKVHACGFEAAPLAAESYDLAISNVPFGNYRVPDGGGKPYSRFSIHNWFFGKALEMVRPGGLVAFVTSAFTMDARNSSVREYLGRKAKLLGAFRLPATAFKQVANTEVVTDVIVLQKLQSGAYEDASAWMETEKVAVDYGEARINRYFTANPDRVIGSHTLCRGMHGAQTVSVAFDGDIKAALDGQVAKFPVDCYSQERWEERAAKARASIVVGKTDAPLGSYIVKDGEIWQLNAAEMADEVVMAGKKRDRVVGMIAVRDVARELMAAQVREDVPEAALIRLREKLGTAYDAFVVKFGAISDRANVAAFKDDPSMPLLLSLEVTDAKTGTVSKAAVFTRRTAGGLKSVDSCTSVADAVAVVCNAEGYLSIAALAKLIGKTEDVAESEVLAEGLAFIDPVSTSLVTKDRYLSGDVRKALLEAESAGEGYEANVAALKAVIPEDLVPSEIGARLGSPWIPSDVYEAWAKEGLSDDSVSVVKSAGVGGFTLVVAPYSRKNPSRAGAVKFSTKRADAYTLMEKSLNLQTITIYDTDLNGKRHVAPEATLEARERQEAQETAFVEWLWADPDRATRLGRIYNDTFNRYVEWQPNGSHLTLPGFSYWHKPAQHQLDAIWRIAAGGRNTLLAHVVGAGKTMVMVCAGMELRRLGLARKPMYVVPNHMLEQFGTEFLRSYPSANILLARKADFQGDKRRVLMSRIATGDWDAVIVTHSMFERISMGSSYVEGFINDKLAELDAEMDAGDKHDVTFKEMQRARKVWAARLDALAASGAEKDAGLTFDQLGVDRLFVDEAHLFKNLYRFTKMQRVAGLPNSNAARAFDMLLKVRFIESQHGGAGDGVVFATGTPVANSMAELWVMQHYLQPAALASMGVQSFDAWASAFGQVVTAVELAPDGSGYRMNKRFAKFINLPELIGLFAQVADVKTAAMLNLPTPHVDRLTVAAPASEALKSYVASLVERAEDIRNGRVRPQEDNMLSVTNDGRLAALDMRLVDPTGMDNPESKVNRCVANVHKEWVNTAKDRGTQLVFCDLSTPASAGFNVYADARAKLVGMGIPVSEIAFIHDYDTDAAKERLFEAVRQGVVRVVFGSTAKMGVGTNIQDRLVALHHLDAPWRPADVEQREGRIERRGNTNANVRIYRYVTEGSFDAYMWQTLESKARFIAQVMSGSNGVRTAEDVSLAALSYAEVKALASGNPLVLEKAGIDAEVTKLSILQGRHERRAASLRQEAASLPDVIGWRTRMLATMEDDAKALLAVRNEPLVMEDGREVTDAKSKADALAEARLHVAEAALHYKMREVFVATVGDATITMKALLGGGVRMTVKRKVALEFDVPSTGLYILKALESSHAAMAERVVEMAGLVETASQRLAALKGQTDCGFESAARLAELLQRQREVNMKLGIYDATRGAEDDQDAEQIAA